MSMMTVCYVINGIFQGTAEVPSWEPLPVGTIVADPPTDLTVQWMRIGSDWVQYEGPPPSSVGPTSTKRLVSISEWFLRLTNDEVKGFNLLNLQRKSLTEADFGDPTRQWLVYWGIFMTHFERLTNDIDLAHPATIQGLQMFAALVGMSEERLDELLSQTPTATI